MTGFARSETQTPQGQLLWELRSVNHRYLETQIRLPEGFRAIEADARQAIARSVRRGKLDAGLTLRQSGDRQLNAMLNPGYARELSPTPASSRPTSARAPPSARWRSCAGPVCCRNRQRAWRACSPSRSAGSTTAISSLNISSLIPLARAAEV